MSFLQNNDMKMFSTHHKGKSIAAERFIRTLNNDIYKNVYIDTENVRSEQVFWLKELKTLCRGHILLVS